MLKGQSIPSGNRGYVKCKLLAWVVKSADTSRDTHGAYSMKANASGTGQGETNEKYSVLSSVRLQLNGHDRFSERRASFFSSVQPYEHLRTSPAAGIHMYSFAIKPAEHQPSGTCNFSRIDNATLVLGTKACAAATDTPIELTSDAVCYGNAVGNLTNLLIFAENYNVLRIMSGILPVV